MTGFLLQKELEDIQAEYYEDNKRKKNLEKEIIQQASTWKHRRVPSLEVRKTELGALAEFSLMDLNSALRSRKVSGELKKRYKTLIQKMQRNSDHADELAREINNFH